MKIRYEIGDSVNVVSGPYAGIHGTVYDFSGDENNYKFHIKTAGGKKIVVAMEQVVHDTATFIRKVWTDDYYYRIEGMDGIWKVQSDYLVSLDGSKAGVISSRHKMASRIKKTTYDLFASHDIPMDGSKFWVYDYKTDSFIGPLLIENDVMRTSNGTYIEMKDSYKGMDTKSFHELLEDIENCEKKGLKIEAEPESGVNERWLPKKRPYGKQPVNVSVNTWKQLFTDRKTGMTLKQLSKKYSIPISTIHRYIQRAGVKKAA